MCRLPRAGLALLLLFVSFNTPNLLGQNVVVVYYSEHWSFSPSTGPN